MNISPRQILVGALVAASAVAGVAATAGAAEPTARGAAKPQLQVDGFGAFVIDEHGAALVDASGVVFGKNPRQATDADITATLAAADATLPAPGECETATASFTIVAPRQSDIALAGVGEVCGHWVQEPTSIVTHVFTGRYEVTDGASKLVGSDGFFEIRLANDGSASAFAIDT